MKRFGWIVALAVMSSVVACSHASSSTAPPPQDPAKTALGNGDFQGALNICMGETDGGAEAGAAPDAASSCDVSWCELIASLSLWVQNDLNAVLLPQFHAGALAGASSGNIGQLLQIDEDMTAISGYVDQVQAGSCHYTLDHLPLTIGDSSIQLLTADVRGEWTPRSAAWIGATIDSFRYIFAAEGGIATVPGADGGMPGLPTLLASVQQRLQAHDAALFGEQADPSIPRGGWQDTNGDGVPDKGDQLFVDLFVPNTDTRVFDFSTADFVKGDDTTPLGPLPTPPGPAKCGYAKWHIDTIVQSPNVGTTDGMSFSPDETQLVWPMKDGSGNYQIQISGVDGSNPTCLTCSTAAWSDGVRWQPVSGSNTLIFISNRDHPGALGGAGGGAGQELYAMRSDGSQQTRLTTSGDWATNYHVNWSWDGKHIVWGTTQGRTWDVMVADFVDDSTGMHLANQQRLTHDTTWWETHGFTLDNASVITTNSAAGLMSSDEYMINIATGARTRLTNYPGWDEHGHLSPDGTQFSWISGRWHPAAVEQIAGGQFSPLYDFWWIDPGIFWAFVVPPSGYSTELTVMNADGSNIRQITTDNEVVADNEWSPDGTKILFRESTFGSTPMPKIAMVTFDDCQ